MAFLNPSGGAGTIRPRRVQKPTAWSYRPGKTPLHRCPPGIKLILLILAAASSAGGLPYMGAAGILILAGAVFAGIPPEELLTGSRPLAVMLLCTGLFRALRFPPSLDAAGLREALRFGAGILLSFAAGALFFAVTTMTEIRRFLEKSEALAAKPLEFFLRRPLPRRRRLSLALALMLGFLPRFFELWEGSETACRSRGCTGSLRRTILIVPLVAGRMIKLAGETAEALEARGLEV